MVALTAKQVITQIGCPSVFTNSRHQQPLLIEKGKKKKKAIKGMKMITRDYFPIRLILLYNLCGLYFWENQYNNIVSTWTQWPGKIYPRKYTHPLLIEEHHCKKSKEIIMKKRAKESEK